MSLHCAELEPGRIKNNVIVVILMPVIDTVHRDIHTHTLFSLYCRSLR